MPISPDTIALLQHQTSHEELIVGHCAGIRAVSDDAEQRATRRLDLDAEGDERQRLETNARSWANCGRLSSRILDLVAHHYNVLGRQSQHAKSLINADGDAPRRTDLSGELRAGAEDLVGTAQRVDHNLELLDGHLTLINGDDAAVETVRGKMAELTEQIRRLHDLSRRYQMQLSDQLGPPPPDLSRLDNVVSLADAAAAKPRSHAVSPHETG